MRIGRPTPLVLAVLALAPAAGAAPTLPAANVLLAGGGTVDAIRHVGNRLLLLGTFDRIGPYVGGGLAVDPASGAPHPGFPRFDGQVSDVLDDGRGGWYVGGQFYLDGAPPVRHLVHVLASGALDPAFRDTSDDFVTALALAGGRLYATRWFKGGVRAFDPATGARVAGFGQKAPASASELDVADGRLYVGGDSAVIAVDPATGARVGAFDCRVCDRGQVSALAHDGARLYVGRRGGALFAVDLATGAADPTFAPAGGPGENLYSDDSGPLVLAVDGERLLVGGRNLRLGGASSTLVALDRASGAADPGFARGFDRPVHDMVLRGGAIVAAGARLGGASTLTTLDRATGATRGTADLSLDGPVDALAGGGSRMFVGGRFATRAAIPTDGVALVDARTGGLVPGFAVTSLSSEQYAPNVVVTDRSLVFWRIHYGSYSFSRRTYSVEDVRMDAVSRTTGRPRAAFHAPRIAYDPAGRTFRSLDPGGQSYEAAVVGGGDRIYVGHVLGDPDAVWPQSRVQVLSAATGATVTAFDLPLRGYLTSLALSGDTLYAGGSFRRFRDGRPAHLATLALDPRSGALDPWFDAHTHGPVYNLTLANRRLYLTGVFDRVYPVRRADIAAVDPVTGRVHPRFRAPPTSFFPFEQRYGAPVPVGDRLLSLPPYYTSYQHAVNLVDAATGRRAALPFATRTVDALLPVGRRYYLAAEESLVFPNYADSYRTRSLAGYLRASA